VKTPLSRVSRPICHLWQSSSNSHLAIVEGT
jgi:hypothetical protein